MSNQKQTPKNPLDPAAQPFIPPSRQNSTPGAISSNDPATLRRTQQTHDLDQQRRTSVPRTSENPLAQLHSQAHDSIQSYLGPVFCGDATHRPAQIATFQLPRQLQSSSPGLGQSRTRSQGLSRESAAPILAEHERVLAGTNTQNPGQGGMVHGQRAQGPGTVRAEGTSPPLMGSGLSALQPAGASEQESQSSSREVITEDAREERRTAPGNQDMQDVIAEIRDMQNETTLTLRRFEENFES
jgi:hypothetical protein